MEDLGKLRPPYWIDDQPDPLETAEDVRDLFERVRVLQAKREAVERASRN